MGRIKEEKQSKHKGWTVGSGSPMIFDRALPPCSSLHQKEKSPTKEEGHCVGSCWAEIQHSWEIHSVRWIAANDIDAYDCRERQSCAEGDCRRSDSLLRDWKGARFERNWCSYQICASQTHDFSK